MSLSEDQVLTISLRDYCEANNVDLANYEIKGIHFETPRKQSLFFRRNRDAADLLKHFIEQIPDATEIVVAYQQLVQDKNTLCASGTALIRKEKKRELSTSQLRILYSKYATELRELRAQQKAFYKKMHETMRPALDDIEAEITYMLLRETKPQTVVEISPYGGWSTSWILSALKKNEQGQLYSFDKIDLSRKIVPSELAENRWHFIEGDVRENLHNIPRTIDYLFMDSDHSLEFTKWYVENVFPKVVSGAPVSVHDIYHRSYPLPEGEYVIDWLSPRGTNYFSPSPLFSLEVFNEIMSIREGIGLNKLIHHSQNNPMIYFYMPNR